jgi:DNA (cytosine-5)-methyltransferase 1
MNGLDLFSGIGGLSIALKPWVQTVAYCEQNRYAQAVLLSQMQSGHLDRAPIWDNIETLRGKMLPKIEIIFGGFPCQDISVAGTGKGLAGKRSGLFFEIIRLVKELSPRFVFLENVPAIRTRGLSTVINEFASIGYDSRWTCLSAASVGAPHKRDRWFCLAAHAERIELWNKQRRSSGTCGSRAHEPRNNGEKESLADSDSSRLEKWLNGNSGQLASPFGTNWWATEPTVGRMAYGVSFRLDRIKCLGNAVVPLQAQEAFKKLIGLI